MEQDRDEQVVVVQRGGGQVAAFLIGLAVGAGAALLFAPQSGAETRADIARQARRARGVASRLADDVSERASDAYTTARREVRHRVHDARRGVEEAIDDVKTRVEEAIDDVKTRVEAGKEAGKAATRAAREELQRRLADARTDGSGEET